MPSFLKKNIAGIPAYVWAILVLSAVGLGLYLRRRSQNSQAAPDTGIPPDNSAPFPGTVGGGSGGGGVGGGGGNPPPDFSPITDAISKLETDLTDAIASIPIPSTIPAPASQNPPPTQLGNIPPSAMPGSPATPQAPPPTSVQTPPPSTQPGAVPGASFVWVFNATTFHGQSLPAHSIWYIGDKQLFLNHLGARGLTYAQWKANHPAAALRVFGDR